MNAQSILTSKSEFSASNLQSIQSHQKHKEKTLRDSRELHLPRYKTAMGQSTFEYAAAKEWNDLPKELRACETLGLFKIKTFKFLIALDKTQHICRV